MSSQDAASWRRSSRCGPNWHCVELTRLGERVAMRDSENPGAILTLRAATWTTLLEGISGTRSH